MHYARVIGAAVRKKWQTAEEKEWWYTKLSAVRRTKLTKLFHAQEGKCGYCQAECFLQGSPPSGRVINTRRATLEHIKDQSAGGTDNPRNLMMACKACNSMRGNMEHSRFLEIRSDPRKWRAFINAVDRRRKARKRELAPVKEDRLNQRILQLAVLFILRPDIEELAKQIMEERNKRVQVYYKKLKNRGEFLDNIREDAGLERLD